MRVLARPAASSLNPYTNILYRHVRQLGIRVDSYQFARAVFGQYEIFHVHWPESVFNHGLFSARVTTEALLLAMKRLKQRGTKLIWTVHNLGAHDRRFPLQEAAFWRRFVPLLDGYFALSETGKHAAQQRFPALRGKAGFTIPHPHYRGCYPDHVSREQARSALQLPQACRVLVFVGTIADYKNVPALGFAFSALAGDDLRLVIAGRPRTEAIRQGLEQLAAQDSRILFHPAHVADSELQNYLRAADVVVLPYQEILNSGSAVLALSFDRPVLMPRLGAAEDLERLMGNTWVQLYRGKLEPALLEQALCAAQALPERTAGEHLEQLSPAVVGRATADAYQELVSV